MNEDPIIPKTIHTFWFSGEEKNPLTERCMKSWQTFCPDYKIMVWNGETLPIATLPPNIQALYHRKKWAFVADYTRLKVLYEQGGVYLDSDMELIKPIDRLLHTPLFLGKENAHFLGCSIIGATKDNAFIKSNMQAYEQAEVIRYDAGAPRFRVHLLKEDSDAPFEFTPIPQLFTQVYNQLNEAERKQITVYPTHYFYPFYYNEKFTPACIQADTYSIHWWEASWHDKNKLRNSLRASKYAIVRWIKKLLGRRAVRWIKQCLGI